MLNQFQITELDERNSNIQAEVLKMLEDNGATVKMVDVPLVRYVLPYHYSLIPSEAASNLARYDGLRYGF